MPPAAISRSSTYFPKICGNIAPGYRSAFRAGLLGFAVLGCGAPDPNVTTLTVLTHELAGACAVAGDATELADYELALTALGPFSAGASTTANLGLDAQGRELAFDPRTAGIDAVVSRRQDGDASAPVPALTGHTERRGNTGIDVLLWPSGRSCALSDGPYPSGSAGQALGYASGAGLALVAGEAVNARGGEQGSGPGSALVFDAERGDASLVPREGALHVPRAFATVSAFGDELLVAGGDNPLGSSTLDAAATAEVFSPATHAFHTTLDLTFRRTRHAAVTLADSGETLLIGGIEPDSEGGGAPPREIRLFEAVSPAHGSSISELGELSVGRVSPTALVLDDGRIFVGGGSSPGSDTAHPEGAPLGLVEYFSPDAKSAVLYAELPPRAHRAFAALPGGGVLSVAPCNGSAPGCSCVTKAGTACAASDGTDQQPYVDAFWLDPEGTLEPVLFAPSADAACPTPALPAFAPGSDGAPWLISGDGDASAACLWRFEPWSSESSGGSAPLGPRFVSTRVELDPPPDPRVAPLSLGPDAFVWVATGAATGLFGTRLGHRGPLTRDGELLSAPPNGVPRPTHLAPDHNPNPALGPVRQARASFDPNLFRLTLEPPEPPAPPLTLWVTDARYDDATVTVSIVVPSGSGDASALFPLVLFGSQPFGGDACAWPAASTASIAAGQVTLSAVRHGAAVTLSSAGSTAVRRCASATGPLSVGVRAGAATTTLVSLLVERG